MFTSKQGTDTREVKKCHTKTRRPMQRLEDYLTVVKQQLEKGTLEVVPEIVNGEAIHYIPHQLLMRDQAESRTKDEDSV